MCNLFAEAEFLFILNTKHANRFPSNIRFYSVRASRHSASAFLLHSLPLPLSLSAAAPAGSVCVCFVIALTRSIAHRALCVLVWLSMMELGKNFPSSSSLCVSHWIHSYEIFRCCSQLEWKKWFFKLIPKWKTVIKSELWNENVTTITPPTNQVSHEVSQHSIFFAAFSWPWRRTATKTKTNAWLENFREIDNFPVAFESNFYHLMRKMKQKPVSWFSSDHASSYMRILFTERADPPERDRAHRGGFVFKMAANGVLFSMSCLHICM